MQLRQLVALLLVLVLAVLQRPTPVGAFVSPFQQQRGGYRRVHGTTTRAWLAPLPVLEEEGAIGVLDWSDRFERA